MDAVTLLLGAFCILLFLKIAPTFQKIFIRRRMMDKIPAPPESLIFGSTLTLIRLSPTEKFQWFLKHCKTFNGIFRIRVNFEDFVHLYSPEYVQTILSSTVNISKAPAYKILARWLGTGLVTSTGEKWVHDRKLLTPAFHFNILEDFSIVMTEKVKILISCFEKELLKNPGKPIEMYSLIMKCTLDVICETAMGMNMKIQESEEKFSEILRCITDYAHYRLHYPWGSNDTLFYLTAKGKAYKSSVDFFAQFVDQIITKKLQIRAQQNGKSTQNEEFDELGRKKKKAFLDLILDLNDKENHPLTDEELRDHVNTFTFAGYDTTGSATSWALFAIGNYPEIQDLIHQELEEVFGDSKEPATLKDLAQLKYLDRVIKESLRMYPTVTAISREVTQEVKHGDVVIPQGVSVIIYTYGLHHNEKFWPNPERFDPDRFLPENMKDRHPYAYIPFSAGPRNCIGQRFAQIEEKMILTAILRKWRVKSHKTPSQIRMYNAIILKPEEGIHIYLLPKE